MNFNLKNLHAHIAEIIVFDSWCESKSYAKKLIYLLFFIGVFEKKVTSTTCQIIDTQ